MRDTPVADSGLKTCKLQFALNRNKTGERAPQALGLKHPSPPLNCPYPQGSKQEILLLILSCKR